MLGEGILCDRLLRWDFTVDSSYPLRKYVYTAGLLQQKAVFHDFLKTRQFM